MREGGGRGGGIDGVGEQMSEGKKREEWREGEKEKHEVWKKMMCRTKKAIK